jgi:hypothetical protein
LSKLRSGDRTPAEDKGGQHYRKEKWNLLADEMELSRHGALLRGKRKVQGPTANRAGEALRYWLQTLSLFFLFVNVKTFAVSRAHDFV